MEPQIKKKIWMIGSIVLVLAFITTMPWLLPSKPKSETPKDAIKKKEPVLVEPNLKNITIAYSEHDQSKLKRIFSNTKLVAYDFPQSPVTIHAPSDRGQKSDQLTISDHLYRRKIVLKTTGSPTSLKNFPICIDLDTQQWIEEAKLSMISENLYFTDEDGTTLIPFSIAHGSGKRLPVYG